MRVKLNGTRGEKGDDMLSQRKGMQNRFVTREVVTY